MPRPNPPRKRPRRRPDNVQRAANAEVSLAKQTAQVKERNGAPDPKPPNAKPGPPPKGTKGAPSGRVARMYEPFVPWSKRSYAIFIAMIAAAELVVGAVAYFTLTAPRPEFGLYLLGLSYNPLVVLAAALIAAPVAKFITKESRSLRFMESVMAGIIQYFIWLALFVALTYAIGGFSSSNTPSNGSSSSTSTPLPTAAGTPAASPAASPSASPSASSSGTATIVSTPVAIAGLLVIDIVSFVATFYIYPPLYRRMRIQPPPPRGPRPAKDPKPQDGKQKGPAPKDAAPSAPKSMVDRMDEAQTPDPQAHDPTSRDPTP